MLSKFSVNCFKVLKASTASTFRRIHSDYQRTWMIEPAKQCDRKEILKFVETNFLKEDPLAKALIPGQKPEVFNRIVRACLDQGFSVVAKRTCGDFEVIGACINSRSYMMSGLRYLKLANEADDENVKKLLETMAIVEKDSNVNDKLDQDEILSLGFLSVNEKHWGKGIGLELVKKSVELAGERNFRFAKMNCMNENTKKIAEEVTMKKIWSKSYKDLLCRDERFDRSLPCDVPEPPHLFAYVYYVDLKEMLMKNSEMMERCE
jgi:hypothetical protein